MPGEEAFRLRSPETVWLFQRLPIQIRVVISPTDMSPSLGSGRRRKDFLPRHLRSRMRYLLLPQLERSQLTAGSWDLQFSNMKILLAWAFLCPCALALSRVAVVGAGMAGAHAVDSLYQLHGKEIQIDLYEASNRTGGRAMSFGVKGQVGETMLDI